MINSQTLKRISCYSGSGICPDCGFEGKQLSRHKCKYPGMNLFVDRLMVVNSIIYDDKKQIKKFVK